MFDLHKTLQQIAVFTYKQKFNKSYIFPVKNDKKWQIRASNKYVKEKFP